MRKSEIFSSNWLKAEHLTSPEGKPLSKRVTITAIATDEVKDDAGNVKKQRVVSFDLTDKRLGLNVTNWNSLCTISGQDPDDASADDDKFVGLKIELYRDMVDFKGKRVPAVRIRPVGGWSAPVAESEDDEPLPF